ASIQVWRTARLANKRPRGLVDLCLLCDAFRTTLGSGLADRMAPCLVNERGDLSMANATVRVVIVGHKKEIHRSIVAFQDELLNNLGWFGSIDFFVYEANNDTGNLQAAADKAVADARAALTAPQAAPAAVVGGGGQATSCLQTAVQNGAGPIVPIIQAVGGAEPNNAQNYVTGFKINALATAEYHLDNV